MDEESNAFFHAHKQASIGPKTGVEPTVLKEISPCIGKPKAQSPSSYHPNSSQHLHLLLKAMYMSAMERGFQYQ